MQPERAATQVLERARLLALAIAGAVCGHAITYAVCLPNAGLRASVLRQTGHAYWHGAVAGALVGAVWFVILHATDHARAGRRGELTSFSLLPTARRLAVLQLPIFVVVEVAERLEAGSGLAAIGDHRLLFVGAAVQLVVAALLALAAWALGRTAHAVGRALASATMRVDRALADWALPRADTPFGRVTAPCGSRAPPSLS